MSDQGDPFGRNGKTVIRPRPGAMPSGESSPFNQPQQQPQSTVISNQPFIQNSAQAPFGGGAFSNPANPPAAHEDWMSGAPSAPRQAAPPPSNRRKIPLNVAINAQDTRDMKVTNPIVGAASPLLILLGRLRQLVVDMDAVPLMQHVARSISDFEKTLIGSGIADDQVKIAKYALCATADDIVQNLPGTDKHVWLQYSMLAQFFGQRDSGVGFFQQVKHLTANPTVNYNLLELIHACLSLGFEGQYRATGGDVELQRVRRDVYNTLRTVRPRGDTDISPRWQGMAIKAQRFGARLPISAVASLSAALLAGAFMLARFLLGADADAAAATLVNLHPKTPINIERQSFAALPPVVISSTQLERVRGVLAPEIAEGLVTVDAVGDFIIVRLSNVLLFESGKADVKADFTPIAARITAALNSEPGFIGIIGHTDNVKLRPSNKFKSNFELSVARANSVAEILSSGLNDTARVKVDGKGEDEPVAGNDTKEGRATNRRVEIIIPREETLKS